MSLMGVRWNEMLASKKLSVYFFKKGKETQTAMPESVGEVLTQKCKEETKERGKQTRRKKDRNNVCLQEVLM